MMSIDRLITFYKRDYVGNGGGSRGLAMILVRRQKGRG